MQPDGMGALWWQVSAMKRKTARGLVFQGFRRQEVLRRIAAGGQSYSAGVRRYVRRGRELRKTEGLRDYRMRIADGRG